MQRDPVLQFLDALDGLLARALVADERPDNRFVVHLLELVEAERQRIRGAPEPPWPDTLWHDYRIALVLVEHEISTLFAPFPEPAGQQTIDRVRERVQWLVMLQTDLRKVVEPGPTLH